MRRHLATPAVEGLEERRLLYAVTGDLWRYPARVTYSFVPDGTPISGPTVSTLNQSFNALGISTAAWQQQFEAAFGLWEQVAGIDLARVSDSGAPLASAGNQQDDPRFGDIRISGMPLASGTLALTFLPPPNNGGTLAGDMIVNTAQPWQVGGNYDVETVALHEIGHALGLDHSGLASAVMYAYYNGVKPALTADDVAGLQAIYGPVQNDVFNSGGSNNHSPAQASNLTPWINGSGWVIAPNMVINGPNQGEWFFVQAPANASGNVTITVQSAGLSSLSPSFSVYNSSLQYIPYSSTAAVNSYGGVASKTFSGASPGTGLYIQVSGTGVAGDSSNGLYALEVNFGTGQLGLVAPPNTVVPQQADQGGGSLLDQLDEAVAGLGASDGDITLTDGVQTAQADALTVGPRPRGGFRKAVHHPSASRPHERGRPGEHPGPPGGPVPLSKAAHPRGPRRSR